MYFALNLQYKIGAIFLISEDQTWFQTHKGAEKSPSKKKALTVPSRRTHSGMVHEAPLVSPLQVVPCLLLALPALSYELRSPVAAAHAAVPQLSAEVPGQEQAHFRWMT